MNAARHTAVRGHRLWVVVLLASVLVGASCEQGGVKQSATEPEASAPQAASKGAARAEGPPSLGRTCQADPDCDSYLRCIDAECAVPPAVSGRHDSDTPRVTFVDEQGQEVASFYLELALDADQRRKGMMFRRQMQTGWGMLFVYPDEKLRRFWMQNTFIPLDMVFMDAQGEIVHIIAEAEPLTRTPRRSKRPARFVLELAGGKAAKAGLKPGMEMRLEGVDHNHMPGPK